MNEHIKVSIIVPVYNVEKYIKVCLDSLLSQTLKEIEIIIVNDGSTDTSLEIIQQYKSKFNEKIIVINKQNGGQSSARNMGYKHSKGEYIGFVDADDFVDSSMYYEMYKEVKEHDLDIVQCMYLNWYEDKIEKNHRYNFLDHDTDVMTGREYFQLDPAVGPCDKLYKKNFLDRINFEFKEGIFAEDALVIPQVFYWADKVKYINKVLYYYRRNRVGSTRNPVHISRSIKLAIDKLYVAHELNEFRKKTGWEGNISRVIIPNMITPFMKKEIINTEYRKEIGKQFMKQRCYKVIVENVNGSLIFKFAKLFLHRILSEGKI